MSNKKGIRLKVSKGDPDVAYLTLPNPSLHYNWNRYYNPETGCYTTSDPIGIDGGLNNIWANYLGQPLNLKTCMTFPTPMSLRGHGNINIRKERLLFRTSHNSGSNYLGILPHKMIRYVCALVGFEGHDKYVESNSEGAVITFVPDSIKEIEFNVNSDLSAHSVFWQTATSYERYKNLTAGE